MSRFENISIRDTEYVRDESGLQVFHVFDPHALTQAAGYLKHVHAHENDESIFFRGQRRLYDGMAPSLFRGLEKTGKQESYVSAMRRKMERIVSANPTFSRFSEAFHEPLLQHYGLRTTWVDLVDNIWVALWFACHRVVSIGQGGQYIHFERRRANWDNQFAYIVLIGAENARSGVGLPGLARGEQTELVDLRIGVPSLFLRPHSQHGVLFRMKGANGARPINYGSQIRGVIRTDLGNALEWLGNGSLLDVHSLFPPPAYDEGYRFLLSTAEPCDGFVGGVSHIGA